MGRGGWKGGTGRRGRSDNAARAVESEGSVMTYRASSLAAAILALPALLGFPALPALLASQAPRSSQSAPKKPRLFPPQDLGLLEAPDRDEWNNPDLIMDSLGIADGAVVADLGAGSGWLEIRLARRV